MSFRITIVVTLLAACAAGCSSQGSRPTTRPAPATPAQLFVTGSTRVIEPADPAGAEIRDVVARLLTAIADGDQATAEGMFDGGRVESLLLRSLIEASRARKELEEAALAAFPDDLRVDQLPLDVPTDMRRKADGLYSYDPVMVGSAAEGPGRYASSSPHQPFYRSLELLERDGQWRVVSFGLTDQEASQVHQAMFQMARSAQDVAGKLRQGRYATLDVAMADLLDGYGRPLAPPGPSF